MDTNSKLSNNTAVVLVSHGSTLPYAEEVFIEIKEKFINTTGLATEIGYMKVSEPTIAGAVEILKDEVDDLNNKNRNSISQILLMVQYEVAKRLEANEKSPSKE